MTMPVAYPAPTVPLLDTVRCRFGTAPTPDPGPTIYRPQADKEPIHDDTIRSEGTDR